MANSLKSALGTTSILLISIGFVLTMVGIILLVGNQNKSKGWYVWFLLVVGIVLLIAGSILLVLLLSKDREKITKKEEKETSDTTQKTTPRDLSKIKSPK